jgi:linoleoyl-CoA desaturase
MAESRQFKYRQKVTASGFSKALSERVDAYFQGGRISRHANLEMISKTVLGFVLWIASYVWLMTGRFTALEVVGVYVVHGFAQLYMTFNIAHDANHGAYSKHKWVNRVMGCVFDLTGVSSYMWRLLHNDSHHAFVNIRGADTTLISGKIFRFTPHDQRRSYHRYQHLYAPFIYCLSTLDWVLTKDFRWLFETRFGNHRIGKHPLGELVVLFAGKAFYYAYMLVIPLIYLKAPWYSIVIGFVVMHFFLGFTIALIFQPNHFNEEATYPEADEEGNISNNYITHIFDTTIDYARGYPFTTWILGGLNLHVIHHMFPGICHVHYPALTRLVITTAEEHGLHYRETRTVTGAFLDHLRWLKVLGNADGDLTSPAGLGRAEASGHGATL